MNNQLRTFMIKESPKTCKTVIDKAKYGSLPDKLTIGEIAELWGQDGLASGSSEWKEVVAFLLDLIRSGKLSCDNISVALGEVDPQKERYEMIVSGLGYTSSCGVGINYNPADAIVGKESFMRFLSEAGGLSVTERLLLNKWFQCLQKIEINQLHVGSKKNLERDKIALTLAKTNPELIAGTPLAVKKKLQSCYGPLFMSGYQDWWDTQSIFPRTSKGGRPKKQ
jgi:hypothetical protein